MLLFNNGKAPLNGNEHVASDLRMYVPHNDGWSAEVKPNSTKEYCYFKSPGDEHFHLLMVGELYLVKDNTKCCLNCAVRQGILTDNRLHWQHGNNGKKVAKKMPLV